MTAIDLFRPFVSEDARRRVVDVLTPDPTTRAKLGKYFAAQFGGRVASLQDGRRVRFGTRGKQRHKKFAVELL